MDMEWVESGNWNGANCVLLDENKSICIVKTRDDDDGIPSRWMFPGGGKEVGESPEECVTREIKEEAQVDVENLEYLMTAYGEVYDDEDNLVTEGDLVLKNRPQFRFIGRAKNIQEFVPEKDGFEIVERKFVTIEELPDYIVWLNNGTNGNEFYEMLKKRLETI